ncbi:hypothetical protein NDU88_003360 [Pleurodeles waltl]|uniref:Uncharacterized protein n=1 Tax=Pleurodeles waltl TaxID=8319 RepID=A0AAV7WNV2_PLEWA|nr:hypothetical protein NDU88_003360 [Pleurodeles waltl]
MKRKTLCSPDCYETHGLAGGNSLHQKRGRAGGRQAQLVQGRERHSAAWTAVTCGLISGKMEEKRKEGGDPTYAEKGRKNWKKQGQHPSEEEDLVCHHQEGADPGGQQPGERPLSEEVGEPKMIGLEDPRGPAGAVLPTRSGCPSAHNSPNGLHFCGGLP